MAWKRHIEPRTLRGTTTRSLPPGTTRSAVRLGMVTACGAILAVGFALTGCADAGIRVQGGPGTTQSPTAACPHVEEVADSTRGCAIYDPDAAMAENERYRQQMPVDADVQAELDSYVEPARAALESLAEPAGVDDVVRALGSVGFDERGVQTLSSDDTGIAFGASAPGGCVTGGVSVDGTVEVSAGGYILDGGCLAMIGH